MNRIETLGGYVDLCCSVRRMQGSLAVSRMGGIRLTAIIPNTRPYDPGLTKPTFSATTTIPIRYFVSHGFF